MSTLDDVCSTMHAVSEGSEKTLMEVMQFCVQAFLSSNDYGYFSAHEVDCLQICKTV